MGKISADSISYDYGQPGHRVTLILHASNDQTEDLYQCRNKRGEVVVSIDPEGNFQAKNCKELVHSVPPEGFYRVTNLFVNPETGKLEVEYDDGS